MPGRLKTLLSTSTCLTVAVTLLVPVFGSGCGSGGAKSQSGTSAALRSPSNLAPIHGTYAPSIDPSNFVVAVDNRYWPLKPGMPV